MEEEAGRNVNGEAAAGFLFFFDVLIGDDVDDFVFLAVFCGVVSAAADIVVCGGAVRFDDDHEGCQMDGGVVEEEAALARRENDDDGDGDEEELFGVVAAAIPLSHTKSSMGRKNKNSISVHHIKAHVTASMRYTITFSNS